MSQTQLAAAVFVARSAVAQWEQQNGPRPTNKHMAQIAVCCNVCYEWLTTGRGAIVADAQDPGALALDIELHLYARDELEKRLLRGFRELGYPGNQGLVELVETFTNRKSRSAFPTKAHEFEKGKSTPHEN